MSVLKGLTGSKKFCKIQIQAVQGVDIATLKWQPLAVGLDSEGQQVVLEWNSVQKIFRAEGLPFRSAQFVKQLALN